MAASAAVLPARTDATLPVHAGLPGHGKLDPTSPHELGRRQRDAFELMQRAGWE
jgi:hypothetical protein